MKTLACTLLLCLTLVTAVNAQAKVQNFGLKDQNDKYTEVSFPSDRPVVLIFGDRKGAGQIDGWSQPIYKKYEGKVYVFGIASLGGVPSYARGLVRRLIKRQTSYSVLMDWGGKVARSLGYEKDKAMLVVVDKNGTVLVKKYGAASESELEQLYAELNRKLK